MSKVNDKIISDLKSRQNLIDKKYGEGSTKKLIDLSESLSSLYDERRKLMKLYCLKGLAGRPLRLLPQL